MIDLIPPLSDMRSKQNQEMPSVALSRSLSRKLAWRPWLTFEQQCSIHWFILLLFLTYQTGLLVCSMLIVKRLSKSFILINGFILCNTCRFSFTPIFGPESMLEICIALWGRAGPIKHDPVSRKERKYSQITPWQTNLRHKILICDFASDAPGKDHHLWYSKTLKSNRSNTKKRKWIYRIKDMTKWDQFLRTLLWS